MKFVIRRAVVGVIALPLVAGAYVFGYIALVYFGAEESLTLEQVMSNGFLIGFVSAVAFAFASQFNKLVSRIVGE